MNPKKLRDFDIQKDVDYDKIKEVVESITPQQMEKVNRLIMATAQALRVIGVNLARILNEGQMQKLKEAFSGEHPEDGS